jgi:hypothetical protein
MLARNVYFGGQVFEQVERFFFGLPIVVAMSVGFIWLNKFMAQKLANKGLFISVLVLYFILSVIGCFVFTGIFA